MINHAPEKHQLEAKKMSQQLRLFAFLQENPGLVPSIYISAVECSDRGEWVLLFA